MGQRERESGGVIFCKVFVENKNIEGWVGEPSSAPRTFTVSQLHRKRGGGCTSSSNKPGTLLSISIVSHQEVIICNGVVGISGWRLGVNGAMPKE
jgi:hypothetical protein